MLYVDVIHTSGQRFRIPVTQVSVHAGTGDPVSVTYEQNGFILHSDRAQGDFATVCSSLKVKKIKVD